MKLLADKNVFTGDNKAWSPYSCNGRKHHCKHVSDFVPSSFELYCKSESNGYGKTIANSFATHCTHGLFIEKL